jgi:putative FmdB family regulatory protein
MPLYDYKCTQCGTIAEIRRGFDESHDAPCAACGGRMARVFNPAPIVFKGSGFYVTDSRKSKAATAPAATESKSAPASGEGGDAIKTDTPKADAPATPPAASSGDSKSAEPAA